MSAWLRAAWQCLGCLLLLSLASPGPARADMGMIRASSARVHEDAQKAIILHNLEEEVLILGTDLAADTPTTIVRFIAFPSEPVVSLAQPDAFTAAAKLIAENRLVFFHYSKSKGGPAPEAVELRFHERLGAHTITVIKVNDASQIRRWANEFFRPEGLPPQERYAEIESVVDDYVKRGIDYFVLDVVGVTTQTRFIEPIQYRFKSEQVYYPLKTTNTFGGHGEIDLIVFAPRTLCQPLADGYFKGCFDLERMSGSTSAQVSPAQLGKIYADADAFFKGEHIYLQLTRWYGAYQFDRDIRWRPSRGVDAALSADQLIGPGSNNYADAVSRMFPEARCHVRPDPGPCKARLERYYYDATAKRCAEFAWGGCQGIVPFTTREECTVNCEGAK